MTFLRTENYKDHMISIHVDDSPEDPREFSGVGTMVAFHSKYALGDPTDISIDDFESFEEMEKHIKEELGGLVILPLYVYDHGGLAMRTKPFCSTFDSGQVGFIYATREGINKIYGDNEPEEHLKAAQVCLEMEVTIYNEYLLGDVYGYEVTGPLCNEDCWGFYGADSMMLDVAANIDLAIEKDKGNITVNLVLSAYTRMECSKSVRVPADTTEEQMQAMLEEFEEEDRNDTTGLDYTADLEYWEQGQATFHKVEE